MLLASFDWTSTLLSRRLRIWAAGLLSLVLAFSAVGTAQADPIRRLAQNPRGLALGGTGMSYADDEMGLYYNPAGLASVDNWWVELLPIMIETSPDAVEFGQNIAGGDAGLDNVSGLIKDLAGRDFHLRAMYYPTAIVNITDGFTFGGGAFFEVEVDLEIRNVAFPETEAYYRLDQGQAYAVTFPLGEGTFLTGIGARTIKRETGAGTITTAKLIEIADSGESLDITKELDIRKGETTAYDLGFLWRLESFSALRGQFAMVVQNVGDASFGSVKKGAPDPIPQEIGFGWSFRPRFTPIINGLFALEFRDVGFAATDDDSIDKRTHFGIEVGIIPMDISTNLVTFRVGYGSGQVSYGLEISLWHSFTLQYVFYGQEYGELAGDDPRERQLLQFNLLGF